MDTSHTLLLHDLPPRMVTGSYGAVLHADGSARVCVGCFSCWVRTPGVCAQPDQWSHMGRSIAACDRLWIVSRCLYGGPGPEVKALLDRSIPYMHPDFAIRGGEMHHKMRLDHHPDLRVLFYGDITQAERETAGRWVRALARNLDFPLERVAFYLSAAELEGEL